jgi:hypothetical protein
MAIAATVVEGEPYGTTEKPVDSGADVYQPVTTNAMTTSYRALWLLVLGLGLISEAFVVTEYLATFRVHWIAVGIGCAFISIFVTGLALQWGPTLPCTILGMLAACSIASLFTSPLTTLDVEVLLGLPIVGAVVGAFLGASLQRLTDRGSEQGSTNSIGSSSPD